MCKETPLCVECLLKHANITKHTIKTIREQFGDKGYLWNVKNAEYEQVMQTVNTLTMINIGKRECLCTITEQGSRIIQ